MRILSRDAAVGVAVCLSAILLCAPFLAYVPWIGDEGILLRGATEMLRGRVLYADFFELHPPGGFLLTEAWLRMAGVSLTSLRLLSIVTVAAIAVLTYLACVKVSGGPFLSAVLALAWVVLSQGAWTQVNHHYFTTAFSMAALLAVLWGGARGAALAGLFAGAAGMVTSTRGALAVIAALVSLGMRWKLWLPFLIGCALIPFLCLAYLAAHGTLLAAWDDVIVWTATRYSAIQGTPFGAGRTHQNGPLVVAFPLALAFGTVLLVQARKGGAHPVPIPCAAFAIGGFVGCYPRPDAWHIAFCAPLALPLIAHGYDRVVGTWSPRWQAGVAALALLAMTPAGLDYARVAKRALLTPAAETPAGAGAFAEPDAGAIVGRVAALPKTDGVFFYPYMPLVPVLADREHVSSVDVFVPGYTTPEQYQAACREVAARARWVVYDRQWSDPVFLTQVFPQMIDPRPAETRRFERVLRSAFTPLRREGRFELMRRVNGVPGDICER